jgi:Transglycosylase SLT domain
MMLSLEGLDGTYDSQILAAIPTYCPSCPPSLVLALVQKESGGNQYGANGAPLVGAAGDTGLFQIIPSTAASLGVDATTPAGNIQGGLTLLQQNYSRYGDWTQALEAYNEGPTNLANQIAAGQTPASAGYASSILAAAGISDSSGVSSPSGTPDDSDDSDDGDDSSDTILGLSTGAWWAIAGIVGVLAIAEL